MNKCELIFATGNEHKLSEIKAIISHKINLKGMREIGYSDDIEEYGLTLEENARIKSTCIYDQFNTNCFSDDTGLEIDTLNGKPGVYSARFAGPNCSFDDNMDKVLDLLKTIPKENRTARFRTIINLWWNNKNYSFEGIVTGKIEHAKKGANGFGYDPIFTPDGESKTFAEMTQTEKSAHSHRAKAIKKLIDFLDKQTTV